MSHADPVHPQQRSLPELIEESNQLKEQSIKIREKLDEVNEQIRNRVEELQVDRSDANNPPNHSKPKS
jgi:uncharacterized coiled-coil DUF342 family protein